MIITYQVNIPLNTKEVIELYKRTSLGARRPVDRLDIFEKMVTNANLIISAWDKDKLVGMARSLSDFAYVTYLADLLVDEQYQSQGIGKALINHTLANIEKESKLVLLAAPAAKDYYPHIGFQSHPSAWVLDNK